MRISDWSSDVCSSDLFASGRSAPPHKEGRLPPMRHGTPMSMNLDCSRASTCPCNSPADWAKNGLMHMFGTGASPRTEAIIRPVGQRSETTDRSTPSDRSEEHTSELQSLMRISYT